MILDPRHVLEDATEGHRRTCDFLAEPFVTESARLPLECRSLVIEVADQCFDLARRRRWLGSAEFIDVAHAFKLDRHGTTLRLAEERLTIR